MKMKYKKKSTCGALKTNPFNMVSFNIPEDNNFMYLMMQTAVHKILFHNKAGLSLFML